VTFFRYGWVMITDKELLLRNLVSNLRFFHFTDVRNLRSILNHGLLPLSRLRELEIAPYKFDQNRHDRQIFPNGAICISVGHPAKAMARIMHENHYAIIELDPMIWLAEGERLASPTNAASDVMTLATGIDFFEFLYIPSRLEFLKSRYGIFTLFADPFTVLYKSGQQRTYNRSPRMNHAGMPNDPQAELLLNFEVPVSTFKRIFLKNSEIHDLVTEKLGGISSVQFVKSEKLFTERFDASNWFERKADFESAEAWVRKVLAI
jgi:hypothetical protein